MNFLGKNEVIIKLNEKEYKVLKRVLGEAHPGPRFQYPTRRQWKETEGVRKGFPKRLVYFYEFVRAWTDDLEYDIDLPSEEEILHRFYESYKHNQYMPLRHRGTSKNTNSTLNIETMIHPDGTFEVKISLENEEHNFKTKRIFSENTVKGKDIHVYLINILTKYSSHSPSWCDEYISEDE